MKMSLILQISSWNLGMSEYMVKPQKIIAETNDSTACNYQNSCEHQ